jgi:tRNA U34 5-carboxymethylaminomethyl modifying GTPase MnmE/TrmE
MVSQGWAEQVATIEESLSALHRIARTSAGSSNPTSLEYLQELRQKVAEGDFYLAVLGLFKRGKSTLINALLQSDALPVGLVPVTSVITMLRYGDTKSATVSFHSGATRVVAIPELPDYVTEAGNPGNTKGVKEVEVRLPSPLLKSGVTIIDTPGVGSTYSGGTQTTYQFLERVDACIFTLAVDPPIGQAEVDLLKAIKPYAKKLIFVFNKKDNVDEPGLNEAMGFCREVIRSSLGLDGIAIYPISAKWALDGYREADARKIADSGMAELTTALDNLIHGEKQEILIASIAAKALKVAEDLHVSLEIAIRSAEMPLNQLEKTLEQLDKFLQVVDSKKREVFYLLDGKSKEIVQMLDEDLERFKKEQEAGFLSRLESYAKDAIGSKLGLGETTTRLEERLREELKATFSDFASSEDERIEARFNELAVTFSRQVDVLVGDVRREVSTLFGIKTESPTPETGLTPEHMFYYRTDSLSPSNLMFVGEMTALLPKFLLKGTLMKRFMGQAKEAFDGTAGRIRYDYFVVRLDKGIVGLKREVGRLLDSSVLAARNAAVEGTNLRRRSRLEVEDALRGLSGAAAEIQSVKDRLGELMRPRGGVEGVIQPSSRGGAREG